MFDLHIVTGSDGYWIVGETIEEGPFTERQDAVEALAEHERALSEMLDTRLQREHNEATHMSEGITDDYIRAQDLEFKLSDARRALLEILKEMEDAPVGPADPVIVRVQDIAKRALYPAPTE